MSDTGIAGKVRATLHKKETNVNHDSKTAVNTNTKKHERAAQEDTLSTPPTKRRKEEATMAADGVATIPRNPIQTISVPALKFKDGTLTIDIRYNDQKTPAQKRVYMSGIIIHLAEYAPRTRWLRGSIETSTRDEESRVLYDIHVQEIKALVRQIIACSRSKQLEEFRLTVHMDVWNFYQMKLAAGFFDVSEVVDKWVLDYKVKGQELITVYPNCPLLTQLGEVYDEDFRT